MVSHYHRMFFPYCLGVSYLRNPFLGSSMKSSKLRSVHHHNMPYAIIFLLININKPSPLAVMLVLYTSGTICQSRSTIKKTEKRKTTHCPDMFRFDGQIYRLYRSILQSNFQVMSVIYPRFHPSSPYNVVPLRDQFDTSTIYPKDRS